MFNSIRNLDPVPNDCCVFRLARLPKDFAQKGNISAIQLQLDEEFTLSTLDKKSVPPHLSVWVESQTKPEQAYCFLTENAPNSPRKLVLRLPVQEIRDLVGCSGQGTIHSQILDVIWVFLFENSEKRVSDRRPGADGHSGITGLDENSAPSGLTKTQAKLLHKDLRSKLADIASKNHRPMENFPS